MAEGYRITTNDIKKLVTLVGGMVKDLAPEELRANLKVTNASSRSKFLMRAAFDGNGFFVAETHGASFKIAAGGKEIALRQGLTKEAASEVKAHVKEVLQERYARMAANWNLNAPLRNVLGVRASEDGGYIRLEFNGLTPQAYKRMVEALVPLMHVPRYDREDPL